MSRTGSFTEGSDVDNMLLVDDSEYGSVDGSESFPGSDSSSEYEESTSTDQSRSFPGSDSDTGYEELGSFNDDSGSTVSDSGYRYEESGSDDNVGSFPGSNSGLGVFGSTDNSGSYVGSDSASNNTICTNISVVGDATYCIEGLICSGDGSIPTSYNCPMKSDVSIGDCLTNMRSFLNGECVAPRDSACHKMKTGVWGCAWDDELLTPNEVDVPTSATKVPKTGDCTGVRVDGDATYCTTGTICSGSGKKPVGTSCPKSGDVAVGDCQDYLLSYSSGKCEAPNDSVCQKLESGSWGCIWSNSKADNGASFVIDTSDISNTDVGGGTNAALVGGIVAAVVLVGVIVVVAIARRKRQSRHPRLDVTIDAVLTPQSSPRNATFQRV